MHETENQPVSLRIKILAIIFILATGAIVTELTLSTAMVYRHRSTGFLRDGNSLFSTALAIRKLLGRAGLIAYTGERYEFSGKSDPEPFIVLDPYFGTRANPGAYSHYYRRREVRGSNQPWESVRTKVTINADGSRWTGGRAELLASEQTPNIYIFGDSFVFGSGLNDEQTFSYLLQSVLHTAKVHLFAFPGYGLSQAYLRFELLKDTIKDNDVIVIAYADYYDVRNVAAPSRIRTHVKYSSHVESAGRQATLLPQVRLSDTGEIGFNMVKIECPGVDNYCGKPDPDQEYMTKVSAALVNRIAERTEAKVFLLYLEGAKENPMIAALDKRIELVSVLESDFDYKIRDDVMGFDPHPGPYWHYAVFTKLRERLSLR